MVSLDSKKKCGVLGTPPYVYPGKGERVIGIMTAKNFYSHKIFYFWEVFSSSLNKVSTRGLNLLRVAYSLNIVSSV